MDTETETIADSYESDPCTDDETDAETDLEDEDDMDPNDEHCPECGGTDIPIMDWYNTIIRGVSCVRLYCVECAEGLMLEKAS